MTVNIGDNAPEFRLQDTSGEERSLSELNSGRQVVLLFFPLAFTSTCREELCMTRDNMKMYEALDAAVAGISVDSFFALRKFKQAHNFNFSLLSDFNRKVSERYGVLYEDYYGMQGVSKRASFVVDRGGVIRWAEVLEDAGNLPDFDAIRSALQEGAGERG